MSQNNHPPALYVVATPIGNLDDITLRASKVLKNVDLIAAEDTRRARQLLSLIGREKAEIVSYYDQVENEKARYLVERMVQDSISVALISDAGTPCISDPGYRLVKAAREAGITVHPVPGASAMTSLASVSGLATDRLLFVGFLPTKKGALEKEIGSWATLRASIIFYESPRRLAKVFPLIYARYPQAKVVIGRELTKLHEEIVSTDSQGAIDWCQDHGFLKGEAVVMIEPGAGDNHETQGDIASQLKEEASLAFQRGQSLKDLLILMKDRGLSRSELYQLLLEAKDDQNDED